MASEFRCGHLDILGNVDDHRPRPSLGRDMEGFLHDGRQIGGLFDQIIMFGAMARDADRVGFLKGVGADQIGRDLAGYDNHRNAVHQRVGDAGHGIGGAGPRCDQHDTRFPGRARIAFGHMRRALFVAHQDVLDLVLFVQRVVNGKHSAARIAEHGIHAKVQEGLYQYVGAALFGHIMLH